MLNMRSMLLQLGCLLSMLACGEGTIYSGTVPGEGDVRSSEYGLVSTGAQVQANTAYASLSPKSVFHVSVTGNDANAGTAAKPWRTISKAVRTLTAGQAAYVHYGTYNESLSITTRDGTSSAPIFLMGAPGEAKPSIKGVSTAPVVRVTRSYWIVDGFDINANGKQAHGVRVEGGRFVTIRNNWIHNGIGPSAVPVYGGSKDIWYFRNKVYDFKWVVNGVRRDSHGFFTIPDAERILIQENEAYNMGGDGFQCQGIAQAGFGTMDPRDITVIDNRFHHNTENAIDIKSCNRITVKGGAKDGNKFFGHRPASDTGTHCAGAAIVIHYAANQILVEKSRFWDNGMGITVGRDDHLTQNIVIRHNLFFGLNNVANGCGDGVRIAKVRNISVYNNTFDNITRSAIRVGVDNASTLSEGVTIYNNIMRGTANALDISSRLAPLLKSDRNMIWGGTGTLRYNGASLSLATWKNTAKLDSSSTQQDPMFVADPTSNDYFTLGGSPARDRALVIASNTYCGGGQDLGFLESCE